MLETIIGFGTVLVGSFSFVYINRKKQATWFTISNIMAISYLILFVIQMIVCYMFDLQKPTIIYWLVVLVFLFVSFVSDNIGYSLARKLSINGRRIKLGHPSLVMGRRNKKILDLICISCSIFCMLKFLMLAKNAPHMFLIVQESFQEMYTYGIFYVRLFLMIATVYYLGCRKFTWWDFFVGMLCMIPNILTFVKGIIIIPCLASFLLKLKQKEIKISLKSALLIVFLCFFVFFGVYLIEGGIYDISVLTDIEVYNTIGSKMIHYLIAGVQSFSQNIADGYDQFRKVDNVTLTPIINFISKFGIGSSIKNVTVIDQFINYGNGLVFTTNVNSYIGSLFLYNGMIGGNLLNFIWTFLSSFMLELFEKRNDLLTAMSCLFLAAFALGWFELYFVHTFWIYFIVIAISVNFMFSIISKFLRGSKNVYGK